MPDIIRNGVRIHYEEEGEGFPLLLLMGLGADGSAWKPHRDVYRKYFRCISIDNRGAGLSKLGIPEECTIENMALDAIEVLDALGIKKVHVAGISMGGAIAQVIAERKAESVEKLLLINTFFKASTYMKRIMETWKVCYGTLSSLEFDRLLQEFIYSPYTFDEQPEMIRQREKGLQENAKMSREAFCAQCEACITHRADGKAGKIFAKTLIVTGQEDILTPIAMAKELKDHIPQAEIIVNRGGHVEHFEHPEIFNQISLNFLTEEEV